MFIRNGDSRIYLINGLLDSKGTSVARSFSRMKERTTYRKLEEPSSLWNRICVSSCSYRSLLRALLRCLVPWCRSRTCGTRLSLRFRAQFRVLLVCTSEEPSPSRPWGRGGSLRLRRFLPWPLWFLLWTRRKGRRHKAILLCWRFIPCLQSEI